MGFLDRFRKDPTPEVEDWTFTDEAEGIPIMKETPEGALEQQISDKGAEIASFNSETMERGTDDAVEQLLTRKLELAVLEKQLADLKEREVSGTDEEEIAVTNAQGKAQAVDYAQRILDKHRSESAQEVIRKTAA